MFKLLITCIILGLMGVIIWVVYKVVQGSLTPTPKGNIDSIIADLNEQLRIAETYNESGLFEAEEKVMFLKEELRKAKELKNKLNEK